MCWKYQTHFKKDKTMTELLLENKNESKIEKIMEELLNDYKKSLIKNEQEERDVLDYIQMDIDIMKNHGIPFYSNKYGVSSIDKEYLNLILNFFEDLSNSFKLIRIENSYEDSDSHELITELIVTWNNQSEEVIENINHKFEQYNEERTSHNKDWESLSIMGKCIENIYDEHKFDGNEFKFHKDDFVKLIETKTYLESGVNENREDYNNSKKQCLRTIKKVNHIIHKITKKGIQTPLLIICENLSPFLKIDDEFTSISLNV
jgi:hypothetical protein